MSQSNLTVDDISPMISYEGDWESLTTNHPSDETTTAIESFHGNTLHALDSEGSAELQFVGRGISVWGPRRPNSSWCKALLDDDDGDVINTASSGTNSSESALLYRVSNLTPGLHTLRIVNVLRDLQSPWLRIDKFVIELGSDGGDESNVDPDSEIYFKPERGGWSRETYGNSTLYASNRTNASLGFRTEGDSLEIYGGQDRNFSRFAVTVDGIRREFSPNAHDFQASVLLFQTEFPQPSSQHAIQIDVLEKKRFELNSVRVVKYPESSKSIEGASASAVKQANVGDQTQTELSSSASSLSGPAIAGIAFGCLSILVLVISALLLWYRKKPRRPLPPSTAFLTFSNTPIYEEFSSVYRSQSEGTGEHSTKHCMDLLDGHPEPAGGERSQYEPYLLMYKTGAVRSAYEATLRPEDSASFHVRSPPPSEVGSQTQQTQSEHATHFTSTESAALPPLSERDSAFRGS